MSQQQKPPQKHPSRRANATRPERADTHVVKRLSPSQPGALKLARRYGGAMVCVRYRHNAQGTYRYTTVELVVDEAPVEKRKMERSHLVDDEIVRVRLAFDDTTRRQQALAAGAQWDARQRLWSMPRRTAKRLRLITSIVKP